MTFGFDYTALEDSLDGPEVGRYHHDGSNGLAGPEQGDIIRLERVMGRWRVNAVLQGTGKLVVERVEDDLVTPHGD
jgi:hypothetical protein